MIDLALSSVNKLIEMEFKSSEQKELLHETLSLIEEGINQLISWNASIADMRELTHSELGMQRLAGNCMLIQAIGEGVKKISKIAGDEFFHQRPEIPWKQVMSMRDRISHGYFDLDIDYITDIVKNDMAPLLEAIVALKTTTIQD